MNILKNLSTAVMIGSVIAMSSAAYAAQNKSGRGSPGSPVIFVTSQGLYYDSIALADLPQKGNFQE